MDVDSAESGEEALRKILKTNYCLIIMDVQMPGLDGFEVVKILSGNKRTKDIPVIFLSALNIEKNTFLKATKLALLNISQSLLILIC
ncbi:response regulator [Flavobacterium sp. P21]|uniref:response regulator n=1 Tax=Flavobacterium sp. P21 TaxID=3423948 RepID=UPI003D66958C